MVELPLCLLHDLFLLVDIKSLYNLRQVCKGWNSVITSPAFMAQRRELTTPWMFSFNVKMGRRYVESAWVYLYNPLYNLRTTVKFPIRDAWLKAKLQRVDAMQCSRAELNVVAVFGKTSPGVDDKRQYCKWKPWTGTLEFRGEHLFPFKTERALASKYRNDYPEELAEEIQQNMWVPLHRYNRLEKCLRLLAFSREHECCQIWKKGREWELLVEMPRAMSRKFLTHFTSNNGVDWAACKYFVLVWTISGPEEERELVVLYDARSKEWSWVKNKWHRHKCCLWENLSGPVYLS